MVVADSIRLMESGLISYLVHPDMCFWHTDSMDPEAKAIFRPLFEASMALDIPLELNANGVRRGQMTDSRGNPRWAYPFGPFWEFAAECGLKKVTIGTDAQRPVDIYSCFEDCMEFVRTYGFELCNREVAEKIIAKKKSC